MPNDTPTTTLDPALRFQTPHEPMQQSIVNLSPDNKTAVKLLNEKELDKLQRIKIFVRKYFLEGQRLNHTYAERIDVKDILGPNVYKNWSVEEQEYSSKAVKSISKLDKYRKYIGFLIPFIFMHLIWWTLAIRYNIFRLYATRYQLPITMILGATVAGMTSEGGGAVAFPVMTLMLHIDPIVARDFSLMIQSCGMTSAAFTIIWMQIKLEWNAIIFSSIGSTIGIVFGLEYVDELITVPVVVICAPFGSLLASHFHRLVLATFVYVLEIMAVIGFLLTGPDPILVATGFGIVVVSFLFFLGLSHIGKNLHKDEVLNLSFQIKNDPEEQKESLIV